MDHNLEKSVTLYKDYKLTEELDSGRTTIQRTKDSEIDYYDEILMEETYMDYIPGKNLADETTKGKNIPDEYIEDTSYMRTSGPQRKEILWKQYLVFPMIYLKKQVFLSLKQLEKNNE